MKMRSRKKLNKREFDRKARNNINFFGVSPLKIDGKAILHLDLDRPLNGVKNEIRKNED